MENKKPHRQSVDFKEIWNIQTDLKVDQAVWDGIFHNWANPANCAGYKRVTGCAVCEQLRTNGHYTNSKGIVHGVDVAIVGDVHSNYAGLHAVIKNNPSLTALICVGDLALWASEDEARHDVKAYAKTLDNIKSFMVNPKPFDIPVYVVKGNHDDYKNMYSSWFTDLNIHYVQQAEVLTINAIKFGFLGGVYSSVRTFKDAYTFQGREHRFYTVSEIKDLSTKKFDVLITHQAAEKVLPDNLFMKDEGSRELQTLLEVTKPEFYFHGHHHKEYMTFYKDSGTFVYGLGNFSKNPLTYVVMNTLTKEVKI